MNERDLRYMVAIVDCEGLAPAAERLGITQPALTKCIDRLEAECRAELFMRKGRQIILTPAGAILARRARKMLLGMDETMREISDHASGLRGHVRLGAAATITEALIPALIERLMIEAPGITLDLTTGMNDVLKDALLEDRLDLSVSPAILPDDDFDCEPLVFDRVVVVGHRSHPLAGSDVQMSDMLRYEWVLPPESVAIRRWLDHSFERADLPRPTPRVEVNSLVLMPKLIGQSDLLSFTSLHRLANSDLIELKNPATTYRREFGVLHRRDAYLSPAAQTVAALLRAVAIDRSSQLFTLGGPLFDGHGAA